MANTSLPFAKLYSMYVRNVFDTHLGFKWLFLEQIPMLMLMSNIFSWVNIYLFTNAKIKANTWTIPKREKMG